MTPLSGDLGIADLAVLERYADPRALARAGQATLAKLIATASHGHQGAQRARQWLDAAQASLELYAGHPAVHFTGLTPKASETGETDRKGQPMAKAGSSLLRTTLVRAADAARKQDPQLARIYYQQMTERGQDHLGALCVTAASLAERAWTVMRRGAPYLICGTDGRPVTPEQAKKIIAGRWTVPPEIRARRRSEKTGKAPQKVLYGQCTRGSLPRGTTPPHRERPVKQTT